MNPQMDERWKRKGASTVEYIVVLAAVAILAMAVYHALSGDEMAGMIQGKIQAVIDGDLTGDGASPGAGEAPPTEETGTEQSPSPKLDSPPPPEEEDENAALQFAKGAGDVALDFIGFHDAKAAITGVDEEGNEIGWGERLFRGALVVPIAKPVKGGKMALKYGDKALTAGKKNLDDVARKGKKTACGCPSILKNGRITIEAIESNPKVFSGKSANEVADMLRESGYDVTVEKSRRSRSGAKIIKINNPGQGKNITQVQVSPGGGRHGVNPYIKISTSDQGIIKVVDGSESTYKTDGSETAKIIFSGRK
ncbi:hypothetical protein JOD24_001451 [Kroppenstedtia sanguinis]